jgi:soluble lytic murein transglycosylase-like protein
MLDKAIEKLLSAALAGVVGVELAMLAIPSQWRSLHQQVGDSFGVDPNLLHALQLQEDFSGNPRAINANKDAATGRVTSTDHGLMQINSTNFSRLGVTLETVYDPPTNVGAAAKLIKANLETAPHLGLLSQISVYNAGFSAHHDDKGRLRAKLTAGGTFSNQKYVMGVGTWYLLITAASFAPIKTPGWQRA